MASASLTHRFAVALSLLPALALAEPGPSGPYRAESFGRLELSSDGERLQGLTAPGNACNFEGRKSVLTGGFEGNVLVGALTVCQTGPNCAPEESYPVLAIHTADGALSTYVRLRPGCESPAVPKDGRLVFIPAPAEEARGTGEPSGGSASLVARKRDKRSSSEAVSESLKEGDAYLRTGNYVLAAKHFEAAVALDGNNPAAYHSLGLAQLLRGQALEAVRSLEKARFLGLKHPQTEYVLACAYGRAGNKPKGLEALRRAVRYGYRLDAALLTTDADFRHLMGGEAELHAFLKQARSSRKQVDTAKQDP